MNFRFSFFLIVLGHLACQDEHKTLFRSLDHAKTGIHFKNILKETPEFNVMNYSYFYNGGGVAAGDFNNDGFCDLYFTGNLVASHLYLNKGDWKFENIAKEAGVEAAGLWNTGVAVADVNGDGWLDIYVCRSAAKDPDARRNLLFINQQDLTFKEQAKEYGLDDPAYSSHAAFFDFDRDGDLDLFLLNHSVPEYANFDVNIGQLKGRAHEYFGDKLYRNDNGHFIDVSREAGIISNVLGFGLGVAVADFNNDQWPDIYVSNDFNEEDYLYINQQNGTFREELRKWMDYTSLFSMGSDAADLNNDGRMDLITLDMLPQDNYRIKLTSGADNFDKYRTLLKQGFHNQVMRNMLQLNEGSGSFCEIGQMAGISNSDWSWSALVADYDLDGHQDLFISNGYLRDYTNMDFLAFAVDMKLKEGPNSRIEDHLDEMLQHMPEIDVANKLYKNRGLIFEDSSSSWGFTKNELSNGAVYADLDNDGDPDLIVNNVNDFAGVYRNQAVETKRGHFLKLRLQSPSSAIGAYVQLYSDTLIQSRELYTSRGFQSSVEPTLFFGLGNHSKIDSLVVVWPDETREIFDPVPVDHVYIAKKGTGNKSRNQPDPAPEFTIFRETRALEFVHQENDFSDFRIQRLLTTYYSRTGPPIAASDFNADGFTDLVLGGAAGQPAQIFHGTSNGTWIPVKQPDLERDRDFEDTGFTITDIDGDGRNDLIVCSGGNHLPDGHALYAIRAYRNIGQGKMQRIIDFPELTIHATTVVSGDLNGDSHRDIFVGGSYRPQEYPAPTENFVLLNDGKGSFSLTGDLPFAFSRVMDASIEDIDRDGRMDLVLIGEFEPVRIYSLEQNGWTLKGESAEKGWFQSILALDLDNDDALELVAGNLGTNHQLQASFSKPVILYSGDFDRNGTVDPILSSYLGEESYPFVSRDDLISQLPFLKKNFTSYHDYALATITSLLPDLPSAQTDTIQELRTMVYDLIDGSLIGRPLPRDAQVSPVFAIESVDFDRDGRQDLLLFGNNEFNRVKLGEMSANHGVLLHNTGNLQFKAVPAHLSGLNIRGDVRSAQIVEQKENTMLILGINNRTARSYLLQRSSDLPQFF